MNSNIPILMFHHVVPAENLGALAPFAVSRDLFTRQLDRLQHSGFETITLEELFYARQGKGRGRDVAKPVVITFDDCASDLLTYAVPELKRRRMTATFFAVSGKLGGYNDWDAGQGAPKIPLMTGDDLRHLAGEGFEIGSHGMSHANLRQSPPEQIRRELCDSRLMLEKTTGRSVRFFAYPYGEYPQGYARYCREAGYDGAVSIFSRAPTVTSDPYCLRRVLIHEGDRGMRFRFKLSRLYQRLRVHVDRRVLKGVA